VTLLGMHIVNNSTPAAS